MTDPIFFVAISISILAWGTHGALMAVYARKFDGLIVSTYRGLSFVVTMLPLLFLAPYQDVLRIGDHLGTLVLAAVTGAVSYVCTLNSVRYLPLGISASLRQIAYVSGAVLLGALFFAEYLSFYQLVILGFILVCGTALALTRTEHEHLDSTKVGRGMFLALCAGVFSALTFYYFSVLARETHPFAATYFWEVGVGAVSAVYLFGLKITGNYQERLWLPIKDSFRIIVIALLTVFASSGYAVAVTHGPYALATGLVTTTIIITVLAGVILFKERLSKLQLLLIALTVGLMCLLRVFS